MKKSRNQKKSKTVSTNSMINKTNFILLTLLLFVTILVYIQAVKFDFVYWDDDVNVYENLNVINFEWSNFVSKTIDIFSTPIIGNYNPLSIWTFGIENALYGVSNPGNYHLVNILFHLGCTVLVFRIGLQLQLNAIGATILAFLFSLHPMHVESVAWITERKDVLYGFFFLSALHLYIKQKKSYLKSRNIWIALLFILSLFSKIQAVTLPLVFILIDYWFEKEITLKSIVKKWPYLLISLFFGIGGIYLLGQEGSLETNNVFGLIDRIFIGSYSLVVYLIKVIIPFELSPIYPYPAGLGWYHYGSIFIFPAYFLLLYWTYKKQYRIIFFGLSFFLVNIIFLLQILAAGQGLIADRFTYIAYLGLFMIAAWHGSKMIQKVKYKLPTIVLMMIGGIIYSWTSYNQVSIWKNSESLWERAIEHYPLSTLAYGNRANYLRDQGRYREALADYSKGLSIKPNQAQTLNSRAKLYFTLASNTDTLNLALADYNKAIELDPQNGEFYINRGATYARLGNINQGLKDINTGLSLKPDHSAGYANRYIINSQLGNYQAGLADIDSYLALNPYDSDFLYERASVKIKMGYQDNSIVSDLNSAIQINPNKGIYYYRKAVYLASLNQISQAKIAYNNALQLGYRNVNPEIANLLGK